MFEFVSTVNKHNART